MTDLKADPGVAGAQSQLVTDAQPLINDQALIQADLAKLRADLAAQSTTSGGGTTSGDAAENS